MAFSSGNRILVWGAVAASLFIHTMAATSGMLALPIERRSLPRAARNNRRAPQAITINNSERVVSYTANVSIGMPPQMVTLAVDTGSSDLWVFDPNSCESNSCFGGSVSPARSSTLKMLNNKRPFSIAYGDGSKAQGTYYQDSISIGDFNVSKQVYAVANQVHNNVVGLLGLGYANHETAAIAGAKPYPSLLDNMFGENIIQSKAFSMWLDTVEAPSGQILFGGYDADKYVGDLIVMNTQPDAGSDVVTEYLVPWTGLSIGSGNDTVQLTSPSFAARALLDSGTSGMLLPPAIVSAITTYLERNSSGVQGLNGPCSDRDKIKGTIDFAFGGPQGGIIKVPIREMWAPLFAAGQPVVQNNETICGLSLISQKTGPYILGDNFLRSAYIVHDLERNQTGLANTNFGSKENKAAPIPAAGLTAIPGAAVATAFMLGASDNIDMRDAPHNMLPAGGKNATSASVAGVNATSASATGMRTPLTQLPQATTPPQAQVSKSSAPRTVPISATWTTALMSMTLMLMLLSGTAGLSWLIS